MSSKIEAPRCRPLPPEIWMRILCHVPEQDLPHIWFTTRHVSQLLRDMTEDVLVKKYLKHTEIRFNDLQETLSRAGWQELPFLHVGFDRLSDDRRRAVFKNKYQGPLQQRSFHQSTTSEWKAEVSAYQGRDDECKNNAPPSVVAVRRMVSDTELPGLEIDYDRLEVSFDWCSMFDMLFCELNHAMKLRHEINADYGYEQLMQILIDTMLSNDPDDNIIVDCMRRLSPRLDGNALREARRLRIRRWYKQRNGIDLPPNYFSTFDDKVQLLELRYTRPDFGMPRLVKDEDLLSLTLEQLFRRMQRRWLLGVAAIYVGMSLPETIASEIEREVRERVYR